MDTKFRCYHKGGSKIYAGMHYDTYPGECFQWLHAGHPVEIMQYIGLPDMSSKDIYDADILYVSGDSRLFLVSFYNEMAGFGYKEIISKKKKFDGRLPAPVPCRKFTMAMLQVLGNKYENPELLMAV